MSTLERLKIHEIEKRAMLLDRAAILELVSLERKLLAVVEAAGKARDALIRRYYNDELESICDELNYVFDQLQPERLDEETK